MRVAVRSSHQIWRKLPCPRSRLRVWFHEMGSAVLSSVNLLILHTQAEYGAYSRDSSRFPRWRPFLYLYRHTPSGQSRVYRVTQLLSYKDALHRTQCESIETTVRTRRLLWAGALLRMGGHRLPKRVMSGELDNAGKRGPGGKEKEWTDCVADDLRLFGVTGDWKGVVGLWTRG